MAPPWLGRAHRWARAVTANALLAASAVALLCAPFAPMLLAQTSAVAARFWIPETTPTSLARLAGSVAVGPFAPAGPHGILGNAGAGAVALAAGWGAVRIARDASRPIGVLLVGIVAVPAAAAVAFSVLVRPIVIPRIFIWATVPLCVLLGVAVASLDRRAARLAAAGLFAALLLSSAWRYHRTAEKEPWRELVAIISRDAAAGDLVVLAPGGNHRGLSYYGRFGPAAPTFVRVEWSPERPALARQSAPLRHRPSDPGGSAPRTLAFVDVTVPHIDELGALARRARAVWLLSRHPPAFPRLTRAVAAELDRTRVAARHWPGTGLSLTLYR
jgi:hypothetical protein